VLGKEAVLKFLYVENTRIPSCPKELPTGHHVSQWAVFPPRFHKVSVLRDSEEMLQTANAVMKGQRDKSSKKDGKSQLQNQVKKKLTQKKHGNHSGQF
jgi:hypothetical protein